MSPSSELGRRAAPGAVTIPTYQPRPGWRPTGLLRAAWRVGLVLGGLSLALLFALLAGHRAMQLNPRALPGILVGELPVGGMSRAQIEAALAQLWPPETPITLLDSQDPSRRWEMPAESLGLQIDFAASAQMAMAYGHSGDPLRDLVELFFLSRQSHSLQPVLLFDEQRARQGLAQLAGAVSIPARDATLQVSEEGILAQRGAPGRELDVEASLQFLRAGPRAVFDYRLLPLITRPVQPGLADASPWAQEARQLISRSYALRLYDPVRDETYLWQPDEGQMLQWLLVERRANGFALGLDQEAMRADLQGWIRALGPERGLALDEAWEAVQAGWESGEPQTLVLRYQPTRIAVQPGESLLALSKRVGMPYWKIMEYNPDLQGLGPLGLSELILPPKDAMLPLPVVLGKRIVVSLDAQRMWALQDGQVLREFVISTGIPSSPTLPGIFQIKSHYLSAYASIWDLTMPHFMGIYDAVPGFENGFHGLPTLSNGVRLWGGVLGTPISYGCIVLGLEEAAWLYQWAEEGVVVEIRYEPYSPGQRPLAPRSTEADRAP